MTTPTAPAIERLPIDERFATLATPDQLDRTIAALHTHGIDARIADTAGEAADMVLSLIPEAAEVHSGASETLATIGLTDVIERSGRFDAVRPKLWAMDRATQADEIRKLGAAPEVFINSAAAVTEDGKIVWASSTGSQLGPLAAGAGKVILVVGAQKVVPDLATAFGRVEGYAFPKEDIRAQGAYGMRSAINKLLVVQGDRPGRTTVILVREALGY
ncbi:MAG: LUD domain-containing protein [Chloroflexota bacterium]